MAEAISELECRVCRLGPEPARPLYAPCLCAGSILYCHQDCLELWLQHSGKDRCELCRAKFEFAPVYVEGAPSSVPLLKALLSVLKMLHRNVLSLLARALWTLVMWLGVVPVSTSLLYRIWIHRGSFLLTELVKGKVISGDVWSDCVAGLIIVAIIVVSFLSLMTFVDFLRFHWGQEGGVADEDGYGELHAEEEEESESGEGGSDMEEEEREDDDEMTGLEEEKELEIAADATLEDAEQRQRLRELLAAVDAREARWRVEETGVWGALETSSDECQPDLLRDMYGEEAEDSQDDEDFTFDRIYDRIGFNENWEQRGEEDMEVDHEEEDDEYDEEDEYDDEDEDDDGDEDDSDPENAQGDFDPDHIIFPQHPAGHPVGRGDEEPHDAIENELDDVRQADVEIHIAFDEVLGWRGPIHISVRNAIWLLAFNGAYIGLFCFVPYSIGSAVITAIQKQAAPLFAGSVLVPQTLVEIVSYLIAKSIEVDSTLQLPEMALVFVGYTVIAGFLFSLAWITKRIQARIPHATTTQLSQILNCAAAVCKVALLLFLRIVLLPISLGTLIMGSLSKVLPYNRADWIMFAASNVMGLLALVWVVGISYMLVITVSVLQLREILHPAFLAQFVRPKEPHPDLFVSLVREPTLVHAKRIASTSAVYVALMILFINIPAALATRMFPAAFPLQPNFVYFIPQLQVPLELAFAYALALGILDGNRVASGQLMYRWAKVVCEAFGLTRFLLPHPLVTRPLSRGRRAAPPADNDEVVGPPLVRPPLGWNNPETNSHLLWAYGRQRKGEIERNLAPVQMPSYCYLRCAAAAVVVWAVTTFLIAMTLTLPVACGRWAMAMFYVPHEYAHDPACTVMGFVLLCCAKWTVSSAANVVFAVPQWYASCRTPPPRQMILAAIGYVLKFHVLTSFALGCLVHLTVCSNDLSAHREHILRTTIQDGLLGFCILHGGLAIAQSGIIDRVLIRLHLRPPQFTAALRGAVRATIQMIASHRWNVREIQILDTLTSPISNHVFKIWGWSTVICLALLKLQQYQLGVPLVSSITEASSIPALDLLVIMGLRLGVFASSALLLARVLANPVWTSVTFLYTQVRDECYVTGRQLQNSTKGQELMRSTSTTVEEQLASLHDS